MGKLKRLVNIPEEQTLLHLMELVKLNHGKVFPKVRLADVILVNKKNTSSDLLTYALKSHFDFVITDKEYFPLFAVEFDGPLHETSSYQIENDKKKDTLCESNDFPLLRIKPEYYNRKYGEFTMLAYIVNYWFASKDIEKAYESGQLDPQDYYDPSMTISLPGNKTGMPFWIAREHRIALINLHKKGSILDRIPSMAFGDDQNRNLVMFGCIRINETHGVFSKNYLFKQNFLFNHHDLLDDILTIELNELVLEGLNGVTPLTPIDQIISEAKDFLTSVEDPSFRHSMDWFSEKLK